MSFPVTLIRSLETLSCRAATGFKRFFGLYSPFEIPRPFIKLPNDP